MSRALGCLLPTMLGLTMLVMLLSVLLAVLLVIYVVIGRLA